MFSQNRISDSETNFYTIIRPKKYFTRHNFLFWSWSFLQVFSTLELLEMILFYISGNSKTDCQNNTGNFKEKFQPVYNHRRFRKILNSNFNLQLNFLMICGHKDLRVNRNRRRRPKVDASIFDSALSHTRRSEASEKKRRK